MRRGLKRGRGKNACRKNGEASDAAVAAPGPYRPPPTLNTHTHIHTHTYILSLTLSLLLTISLGVRDGIDTNDFQAFPRAHTRPPVPFSHPVSLSCLRSFAGSLRPGVCTAARNVRGSSISAAREFDGAGRVAGHAIIERLRRDE